MKGMEEIWRIVLKMHTPLGLLDFVARVQVHVEGDELSYEICLGVLVY